MRAQTYGYALYITECVFKCIDCIIMVGFGNFIELLDMGVSWSIESVLVASIVQ